MISLLIFAIALLTIFLGILNLALLFFLEVKFANRAKKFLAFSVLVQVFLASIVFIFGMELLVSIKLLMTIITVINISIVFGKRNSE